MDNFLKQASSTIGNAVNYFTPPNPYPSLKSPIPTDQQVTHTLPPGFKSPIAQSAVVPHQAGPSGFQNDLQSIARMLPKQTPTNTGTVVNPTAMPQRPMQTGQTGQVRPVRQVMGAKTSPTPLPGQQDWTAKMMKQNPSQGQDYYNKLYQKATQSSGGTYYQPPSPTPTPNPIQGFTTTPVPPQFVGVIARAAKQNDVNPAVLASVLFSEHGFIADQNRSYNRDAQGNIIPGNYDRGIAQINSVAHPDVTDQQAFDPNFAIPYAARLLGTYIKNLGINRGIAAYNVGQGGAQVTGPTPSGLGPNGQAYLNKIGAGLAPQLRSQLGIKSE